MTVRKCRADKTSLTVVQINLYAIQQRLALLVNAIAIDVRMHHAGDAGRRDFAEVLVHGVCTAGEVNFGDGVAVHSLPADRPDLVSTLQIANRRVFKDFVYPGAKLSNEYSPSGRLVSR